MTFTWYQNSLSEATIWNHTLRTYHLHIHNTLPLYLQSKRRPYTFSHQEPITRCQIFRLRNQSYRETTRRMHTLCKVHMLRKEGSWRISQRLAKARVHLYSIVQQVHQLLPFLHVLWPFCFNIIKASWINQGYNHMLSCFWMFWMITLRVSFVVFLPEAITSPSSVMTHLIQKQTRVLRKLSGLWTLC